MPKKFAGENSKAVVSRARKDAAKADVADRKQKVEEDEYWRDDSKHVQKKQSKKEEADRKRAEQQQKKQQAAALLREEEAQLESSTSARRPAAKLTRAQVAAEAERRSAAARTPAVRQPEKGALEPPPTLGENINRLTVEGDEARTIEEAIAVLSVGGGDDADRHPERRMKAAFKAYEEEMLPRLKQENPGMRLSQLKHMLSKEWNKSPQNPMNQKHAAYNAKTGS